MPLILTYHHVDSPSKTEKAHLFVSPDNFEAQLRILASSGHKVVSLDALRAGLLGETPLPPRAAAITFDDGYANNFENAFPVLKKLGMTAAFFIITGRIGGRDDEGRPYMTESQLRELRAAGMTIGSHTVTHPWLGRVARGEARRELVESKSKLEEILGEPIRWLCYPSGSFNDETIEEAKAAGYAGACSVIRDNRVSARQLFFMPRVMPKHDTTPLRFRYHLSPLYHWVHAGKNRKRWGRYLG